jgi:hypothetical protein
MTLYLASGGKANSLSGDGALASAAPDADSPDGFVYDPMNPAPSCAGNVCCTGNAVAGGALRRATARMPRYGSMDWKGFFSVVAEVGYHGAMGIQNEDEFSYPAYSKRNFTEQCKRGFRVAHEFLKTRAPPVAA